MVLAPRCSVQSKNRYERVVLAHVHADIQTLVAQRKAHMVCCPDGDALIPGYSNKAKAAQACELPHQAEKNYHATAVAALIAGKTYGPATRSSIVAVRVLGEDGIGSLSDFLNGLNWVYDNWIAKGKPLAVLNLSMGYVTKKTELDDAVEKASGPPRVPAV